MLKQNKKRLYIGLVWYTTFADFKTKERGQDSYNNRSFVLNTCELITTQYSAAVSVVNLVRCDS